MGFLQITSDGSVLFDDRDRDGLALSRPGALGPDEFPGFHTMPVGAPGVAEQLDLLAGDDAA